MTPSRLQNKTVKLVMDLAAKAEQDAEQRGDIDCGQSAFVGDGDPTEADLRGHEDYMAARKEAVKLRFITQIIRDLANVTGVMYYHYAYRHGSLLRQIGRYESSQLPQRKEDAAYARRKQRKAASDEHFTRKQFDALRAFCDYTCLSCRRREPEITLVADHIVPLACGGSDGISNIQPLCTKCNRDKSTQTIDYRHRG